MEYGCHLLDLLNMSCMHTGSPGVRKASLFSSLSGSLAHRGDRHSGCNRIPLCLLLSSVPPLLSGDHSAAGEVVDIYSLITLLIHRAYEYLKFD